MSDFLEILSLLPNAEHLSFSYVNLGQWQTQRQLSNENLKLQQLRTLELIECNEKFLVLFNKLPPGVLKKLVVGDWNLNLHLLTALFNHQPNIKESILSRGDINNRDDSGSEIPDHILDHLKLDTLEWHKAGFNSKYATILSKQNILSSLSLHMGKVDADFLNFITKQLSQLNTLNIRVDEALFTPFKKIVKLRNLKDLTLQAVCSTKLIEAFAGLDNSQITTLTLEEIFDDYEDNVVVAAMTINLIAALANSVPNLKVLRNKGDCPTFSSIMQNFNYIEILDIELYSRVDANALIETIKDECCFNPKLTELTITKNFPCEESLLRKLVVFYPNLKKIFIESSTLITASHIKGTLIFYYFSTWKLTTEYFDYIKDNQNNCKSITLKGFNSKSEFTAEQNKILDVIKNDYRALTLAYKTISLLLFFFVSFHFIF